MSQLKEGDQIVVPVGKKKVIWTVMVKDDKLVAYNKAYGYISVNSLRDVRKL